MQGVLHAGCCTLARGCPEVKVEGGTPRHNTAGRGVQHGNMDWHGSAGGHAGQDQRLVRTSPIISQSMKSEAVTGCSWNISQLYSASHSDKDPLAEPTSRCCPPHRPHACGCTLAVPRPSMLQLSAPECACTAGTSRGPPPGRRGCLSSWSNCATPAQVEPYCQFRAAPHAEP